MCVYIYCCHGNRALSVYALVSGKVGAGSPVAMVTGHKLVAAALHPFPEPVEGESLKAQTVDVRQEGCVSIISKGPLKSLLHGVLDTRDVKSNFPLHKNEKYPLTLCQSGK